MFVASIFRIEKVLDTRVQNGRKQVLIRWLYYGPEYDEVRRAAILSFQGVFRIVKIAKKAGKKRFSPVNLKSNRQIRRFGAFFALQNFYSCEAKCEKSACESVFHNQFLLPSIFKSALLLLHFLVDGRKRLDSSKEKFYCTGSKRPKTRDQQR